MKTLAERYPEKLCDCSICGHGVYAHPVKSPDPAHPGKTRIICVFCDFDLMIAENEAAPEPTPIDGSDTPDGDDLDYPALEREAWTGADDMPEEFTYSDDDSDDYRDYEGEGA